MAMWNPWRGCQKFSEGCLHCYIHKADAKKGIDTSQVMQTKDLCKQARLANINYQKQDSRQ